MFDRLRDYVRNWDKIKNGIFPVNEKEFIELFSYFLLNIEDERDVCFDGDGAYFGKQVTIQWNSGVWRGDKDLTFEVPYCDRKIVVYTGNNEGFWVSPYIDLTPNDEYFYLIQTSLFKLLFRAFGLPENGINNK